MSFGLSRGRAVDVTGFGIDRDDLDVPAEGGLDPRVLFERPDRPLEIEIGSGKGTFLVQQAAVQPATNFLGMEWSGEFFRYAADRVRRHGLTNVRVLRDDASEFLKHRCGDAVADVLHLYFTDPWPKKRHHKRRVIQHDTLRRMHAVLRPGGCVHLVTDHDALWDWYESHVAAASGLFERGEFASPASAGDGEVVGTNFERKYRREGRPFHAMTLKRRSE
jgi:tRNA (guanine-N7-)-methyltransferase